MRGSAPPSTCASRCMRQRRRATTTSSTRCSPTSPPSCSTRATAPGRPTSNGRSAISAIRFWNLLTALRSCAVVGKRSDFKRRKHDAYNTTDPRAVRLLKPHLRGVKTFAEPCAGRGDLVRGLEYTGLRCVMENDMNFNGGVDALTLTAADLNGADAIISNTPWTRALLYPLMLHFQRLKPTWLLLDGDWSYNREA